MTHNCQREKVRDGEMAYDENEDVGWQGKEEEHFTCKLAFQLWPRFVCFLNGYELEHRPGCSGNWPSPRFGARVFIRALPRLFAYSLLFLLLESMRRDVRILLVGDGPFIPFSFLVSQTQSATPRFLEGVGKSTIVTSFIKEAFVPHVGSSLTHPSFFFQLIHVPSSAPVGPTCRS